MDWTDLETVQEELAQLVAGCETPVVAFDADSTLWMSDVANRLWDYLLRERLLRVEAGAVIAAALSAQGGEPTGDPHRDVAELFARYASGSADERAVVEVQATGLVGFSEPELRATVRASFAAGPHRLEDVCFAGMRELMDRLRLAGARLLVCSGSPQIVVEEAARLYDIPAEDVCSLRTRIEAGRLTAALDGPVTAGEGKILAYAAACSRPPVAAFGDSPTDLPLLRSATGLACMVNPRPGLRAASATIQAPVRWIRIRSTVAGIPAPVPVEDASTQV